MIFSMQVLNNSAIHTIAVTIINVAHSAVASFKTIPSAIADMVRNKWIQVLCSIFNTDFIPDHA
jgi:formyltetrahydrofolate hydrolase